MIKNYFKTTLRVLLRNRSYTVINILGLSVGIASALVIYFVVTIQTGYDTFHTKKDRIYRMITDSDDNGRLNQNQGTPMPAAPALREDFSQIEGATRTYYAEDGLITIHNERGEAPLKIQEKSGLAFVEPEFFNFFDFPVVAGSVNALAEPMTAALSESAAKKYFGSTSAIGRSIRFENRFDFRVVAITKDFPPNTELPFSVMMSLESARNNREILLGLDLTNWGNIASNTNTWILLKENAAIAEVEAQLPAFDKKHFADPANDRRFRFQKLTEVHFATEYGSHSGQTADRSLLIALSLVALFLIITACINFVNLATAQAIRRAKEVGVRKVLGAKRNQLIVQFLGETFLITLVSILLATGLCEFIMPPVLSALNLTGFVNDLIDTRAILFLSTLTIFVTLLSGLYPGLVMSGYKPVLVLKSASTGSSGGRMILRRALVVVQFVITQVLIISTVIAVGQMEYFITKDLGFNREAVLTVPLPSSEQDKLERLRNGLIEYSGIRSVTFAFASGAANFSWNSTLRYQDQGKEERIRANMRVGDEFYIGTLGLSLIAGRNYSQSDTLKEIVVNETFVKKLGLVSPQDAIGKILIRGNNRPVPIVGVVKDWNTNSLHYGLQPVVLGNYRSLYREAAIKIEMAQTEQTRKHIETVWSGIYPDYVFSSEFLDERIGRFYEQEQLTSNMFKSFAGVAIAIGCLGLFGLVAFMANQKTKEIGVRKVLGASVIDIFKIFTSEFLRLILFAFLIAGPLGYYAMLHWLEDFEYRITIGPGVFLAALFATIAIAALTVGYHTYRAATANPIESFKYE